MKKIILSIFASIILSVTSFSAFAKTEVIWWDLLGGGDGVRMSQMIDAFDRLYKRYGYNEICKKFSYNG